MDRSWMALCSTAVAICLSSPLMAQVTPEEVWQGWQKMGATYGQAIVADSVVRNGDTLVVTGMTTSMSQDDLQISGAIDEIRFRDLGDETVEITMTDTYSIAMTLPDDQGQPQDIAITLTQPGISLIAGGSASRTDYSYTAPSVVMDMQVRADGQSLADVDATFTGLAGSYSMESQSTTTLLDSAVSVDSLRFDIAAGDASEQVKVAGVLAALKIGSSGTFLGIEAMEDMAQAMRDGFMADVTLSYAEGAFTFDIMESGGTTKVVASNQTGNFRTTVGKEALRYGAGGTGVEMKMTGPGIPFPELTLSYNEASFDFLMPLMATPDPVDFTFLTRIVDLAVSDEIWAMFDPTAALPRDPATLILETKGKVRLTSDLLDEAAMVALGDGSPGEIHALDMTDLTVKFAGAELTGTGALTFDNSDLTTFDGVPAPTGKIDLVIRGGNGLINKLVEMGVIPPDQAMGARMMIAMLAKPGDGPDVLNSSLEFRDKGFFANGQQLK